MAKKYSYRAMINIIQGGYHDEGHDVDPQDTDWHETTSMSGSSTHTYWYRDSSCGRDSNSSKMSYSITDTWTASIDEHNYLTVTVSTVINSIVRGDVIGNPNACGTILMDIYIRNNPNGANLYTYTDQNMANTGTLGTNLDLGTNTFTLAPGQELSRGTVYVYNDARSGYDDEMEMGVSFKNILPKDYRPGKIWNGSNWMSHDRSAGFEKIYASSSSTNEMRTVDGAVDTGNPPTIYNSSWYNQRKIGNE